MGGRVARAAWWWSAASIAVVVAGCTSAGAQLASGSLSTGAWAARTYHDAFNGVCVEIVRDGGPAQRLCGLDGNQTSLWQPDPVRAGGDNVVVVNGKPDAVAARVTTPAATLSAPFVSAPTVSAITYAFVVVPAGATLIKVEWIDASGAVIDSIDTP